MKKTRYLCTKVSTLSHRRVTLVDLYRYPAINPKTFRREVELAFG